MSLFKTKKISSVRTVGARLKLVRKRKGISIEDAEEATKVRAKYLEAIEKDNWSEFPSRVYVLGFVRRYAELLDLNSEKILEEFKIEFGRAKTTTKKDHKTAFLPKFVVTPKLIVLAIVILLIAGVIAYLAVSIGRFSRPPTIEITSPREEVIVDRSLLIDGKTQSTAIVEINNQLVGVDDSGHFSQKVELSEGLNIFEIKSKSRLGKESTRALKVIYQPK